MDVISKSNPTIMDERSSLKRKCETELSNPESPSKLSRLESQNEQSQQNMQSKSECKAKDKDKDGSYESQSIINIIEKEVEEINENVNEDCCLNKGNLKSEKEKIRRRRSSFGKYLSKPPLMCVCPENMKKETRDDGTPCIENSSSSQKVESGADIVLDKPDEQKSENAEQLKDEPFVSRKTKLYEEESKKLENEYKTWKKLVKARKIRILEVKSELEEAKRGETVIEEEEFLPLLTREQKTLLLSRPNFQQYLQQIRHSREELVLIDEEVRQVTNTYKSLLEASKIASETCNKIIERLSFPTSAEKDPRVLLASMMET